MQRLLVSVRGPVEAEIAARGGAAIADVEFPASALGTPYPLNILAVRKRLDGSGHRKVQLSTNIGERQDVRPSACQAALGVALAGADLIKFGLAELTLQAAEYLGRSVVRSIREWFPRKRMYPAVFVDEDMTRFFDPVTDGPRLASAIHSDGLLIDTFNKGFGGGLLDYLSLRDVGRFVKAMHRQHREAWIAGSITKQELPELWRTGVDVICVRGAACDRAGGAGRFGNVRAVLVKELVATIP
jgi:uncharacterized protein (UPF0264 family)